MEYLKEEKIEIMVSVSMITYNHEKYIAQAIEGVLMQKTNFKYELIIGEDCSTDNTRKICLDYGEKYPEIIKLRLPKENLGMQQNGYENGIACTGKYIAICEGDDYWIDPLKLQKQVEFLEGNEEYGLVHSDCHFYYQNKNIWKKNANSTLSNTGLIIEKEDLFNRLINADYKIRTATVLFKKHLLDITPKNDLQFLMGDTPMWLDFSQLTKFKYIDEVFAVYRILPNSASKSKNKEKQYRFSLSMAEMRIYYFKKYSYPINNLLKIRYNKALIDYKLFNTKYKMLYPLFNPTNYEIFKLKYIDNDIFRALIKIEWYFLKYINAAINKII